MPKLAWGNYDPFKRLMKAAEMLEKGATKFSEVLDKQIRDILEKEGFQITAPGGMVSTVRGPSGTFASKKQVAATLRQKARNNKNKQSIGQGGPVSQSWLFDEPEEDPLSGSWFAPDDPQLPPPTPSGDEGGGTTIPPEVPMMGGMGMAGMIQAIIKMILESIQKLIENLYELAEAANAPFAGWTKPIEQTTFDILKGEKAPHEIVVAIFDAITNLMTKVIQFAGISKLFNFFNTLMELITNPAFEIFTKLLKGIGGVFEAILGPLEPIFMLLEIVAKILDAALAPVLKELAEEIGPIVVDMLKAIENFDVGDMSSLSTSMADLGESLVDLIGEILSDPEGLVGMLEKIIDFVAAIMRVAPRIIDRMIDFLMMFMRTDEAGVTVFEKIVDSVLELASIIITNQDVLLNFMDALITITKFASGVAEWIMNFLNPPVNSSEPSHEYVPVVGIAQGGAFVDRDKPMMLHAGEFVFTPEQTIELSKMGLGADNTTRRNLEESAKYSKKLYQLFQRNMRFMF